MNFLIPNDVIFTASCCDENSFVVDERGLQTNIKFSDAELKFVDFDDCVRLFNTTAETTQIRTTIIIKNEGLFEDTEYFALLTSADCKVLLIEDEVLLRPSDFYNKMFTNAGIEGCFFDSEKVNYQININKFLGNVYAQNPGC